MSGTKTRFICFVEANVFSQSIHNPKLQQTLNEGILNFPDGIAIAMIAGLVSKHRFERISGPTFLLKCCKYGLSRHWRHYFYGGADGIAEKLANNLKQIFPGLEIAGYYTPPFRSLTKEEEKEIKEHVESSHTDILWVGLGGPKQEIWMSQYCNMINVPVMMGVGAAFDFHSKNRPWAPSILRKLGLEWLWRTLSGGLRTFKRNIVCVSKVALFILADIWRYLILRRQHVSIQETKL